MNTSSAANFSSLLTQAVRTIAIQEDKLIAIVQDEIGHAIGREKGGSSIEYWRKGHIPANPDEVIKLAQELVKRRGLDEEECAHFLRSAGILDSSQLISSLFRIQNQSEVSTAMIRELQPFVTGPPITEPRQFYGREKQVKRIFNWWYRYPLQSVALVGPKRSGKTSLLHYLRSVPYTPTSDLRPNQHNNWLLNPERYQWVVVDFQDYRMTTRSRLLAHILDMLQAPVPDPCNLQNFMDVMIGQLQMPTIILMDEIGAALTSTELDVHFWGSLRSLVSQYAAGNLAFLLTAHDIPNQMAIEQGKASPFFNILNTVKVGPLTESEARELVASSPKAFAPEDVEWMVKQSQCWPALLQILCQTRLMALEEAETDEAWKEEGLQRIDPFRYLLDGDSSAAQED